MHNKYVMTVLNNKTIYTDLLLFTANINYFGPHM